MARKAMVTRTIITTKVNALCVDLSINEVCNEVVTLPRTYKPEKLLKAVEKALDGTTFKPVSIVSVKEVETLYGMDEQTFINNALVLDPETRKVLEAEEENFDEE